MAVCLAVKSSQAELTICITEAASTLNSTSLSPAATERNCRLFEMFIEFFPPLVIQLNVELVEEARILQRICYSHNSIDKESSVTGCDILSIGSPGTTQALKVRKLLDPLSCN
jgi:hypothetical protein